MTKSYIIEIRDKKNKRTRKERTIRMNSIKKLLCVAAALSICLATAGCANEIEYRSPDNFTSSVTDDSSTPDDSSEPDDEKPQDKPDDSDVSVDVPPPPFDDDDDNNQGNSGSLVVKEDDPEYFSKCAFLGEALCSGLSYVDSIPDEFIYTKNTAHVHDIGETSWASADGQTKPLPQVLYEKERKYIYIWVGPNDLTSYNPNSFAAKYEELVNSITYANPMAYVCVVSIAPVSREYEQALGGDAIIDYNLKLSEMVDKIGNNRVRFVNLITVLGDNDGFLKGEFDSGDGLHMTPSAYRAVAEYLLDTQIHPYVTDFELETEDENTEGEGTTEDGTTEDGTTEEGTAEGENADGGEVTE